MKNVIIVGPAYPYRGGIADTNERIAIELIKREIKCEVYSFKKLYPKILFPGKTQYAKEKKLNPNLLVHSKINSTNIFNWIKVGFEIRKKKPDVLLFRYWTPFLSLCYSLITLIVKTNRSTKIITLVDNFYPHERFFGDKLFSYIFIHLMEGCIVMSLSVMSEILTVRKKIDIEYCPHPLFDDYGEIISKNIARKSLKLDENKKYILFFGFVREYKGLDLLLEAFQKAANVIQDLNLIIAGEFYQSKKEYEELIEKFNIKDKITIYDQFIPHSLVPYFFCSVDLVVLPYKSATQSGIVQIAYHFNKPLIVTNVGALPDIVVNNVTGYVVEPNSSAIAYAIIKYFSENNEEKFSKNIFEEKKKYSWDRMIETIFFLYEKIIRKKYGILSNN